MTLNGTRITGPVLIYQDELVVDNRTSPTATPTRNGTLICTSQDQHRVGWHLTNGGNVCDHETGDPVFRQIRTKSGVTPSVSRLSVKRENVFSNASIVNGLLSCQLNGESSVPTPIPVGIYNRIGGE